MTKEGIIIPKSPLNKPFILQFAKQHESFCKKSSIEKSPASLVELDGKIPLNQKQLKHKETYFSAMCSILVTFYGFWIVPSFTITSELFICMRFGESYALRRVR